MHRRDFAKTALVGAALAAATPTASRPRRATPHFTNVLFTADDPGHWTAWVSLHVPETSVEAGKLRIRTPHPQSEEHYIVSHSVVLGTGMFLDRTGFSANDDPVSEHVLPSGYTGRLYVTSTCNRHDTWLKVISV